MTIKAEVLMCVIGACVVLFVGGYIFFSLTTEMEVYEEEYGEVPIILTNPLTDIRFVILLLVTAVVMIVYVKWWLGPHGPGR